MRLKEIKPGMVIHCKDDEEKKALLEEAERIGYMWLNGNKPTELSFPSNYLVFREDGLTKKISWTGNGNKNTEFSDLILPEITAEEAIEWLAQHRLDDEYENAFGFASPFDEILNEECTAEDIVKGIAQWKSEHGKKEPEIEWVYRVFGAENYGEKFFQTEAEAIKRCEELAKSQKTKQYARYERVCRVKAVE